MRFLDKLWQLVRGDAVPAELAELGVTKDAMRTLRRELKRERSKPPRIALIGETGVGKSSTINALFNRGLKISHERACTQHDVEVIGDAGEPVIVVDMPGLGEDVEADEAHYATYHKVLPGVDVALWIIKADNRAMTHVQRAVRRLVDERSLKPEHLVFALNQVDLLQPGAWEDVINQPSLKQEKTIEARRTDIAAKIAQVIEVPAERIVAYSALKYYNLKPLLHAMLTACEDRRRVILFDRARCATFTQLVDLGVLKEAE